MPWTRAGARRKSLATVSLLAIIVGELADRHAGVQAAAFVAWGGLACFLALEVRAVSQAGQFMVGAAAVLGLGTWSLGIVDSAVLARGVDSAAFFALFIGVLGFLRLVASGSKTVRTCGAIITHQPPGRRYLGLSLGAHVLGNLLNMSSLALLGAMVTQASCTGTAPHGAGNEQDQRRMLLACHRGFCAVPLWSPFAMTVALVLSLFPALSWSRYAGIGGGFAVITLALGWALDRVSRPVAQPQPALIAPPEPSVSAPFLRLAGLIAILGGSIFSLSYFAGVRLILAVLTCVPVFALVWRVAQAVPFRSRRQITNTVAAIAHDLTRDLPALRNEVAIMSAAAFIGVVAADMIDPVVVGGLLKRMDMGPALLLALVPWAITAAAMAGMSPIIGIMVLGHVLADLPAPRPPDVAIAAALTSGWACAVSASPFTAVVLIVARLANCSPMEVGLRWNGAFTLLLLATLSGLVSVVAQTVG